MNNSAIYRCVLTMLFVCITQFYSHSQTKVLDSLKKELSLSQSDTGRIRLLIRLSEKTNSIDTSNKLSYALSALELSRKINWAPGLLNSYLTLGVTYSFFYNDDKTAFKYQAEACKLASELKDINNEVKALSSLARSSTRMSQYSKALDYYRKIIDIHTEPTQAIGAYSNMGTIYADIGDYVNALECHSKSLRIINESIQATRSSDASDTIQIAAILYSIGDVYLQMSKYNEALANYETALRYSVQTRNNDLAIYALAGLGKTYQHLNDFKQSIKYFNNLLDISKGEENKREEITALDYLAKCYLSMGATDTAVYYAQLSLRQAISINYTEWMSSSYITLGKIYIQQGRYSDAVRSLEYAVGLCRQNETKDIQKEALQTLSTAYELNKQPEKSLAAYKEYITIRDTLFNINKINELNRIDLQSKFDRDSLQQAGAYQLRMQKQRVYTISGYTGLLLVILLAFFIYRNYSQQKKANKVISDANIRIQDEKAVSEQLLLNILPEEVAKELKTNGSVEARLYDNVTVLFTDFINFTSAAEWFTPEELVAELHTCFMVFDRIMSKYNIEKIKTIGDAYMAAAGLPKPSQTHASDVIKAAFEIRDYMSARKEKLGNRTFGIRIGVNTGTVVAGIVGANKFAYDIWGDTVNIAARMEQYGSEGKINISQSTYELVQDQFAFTDRGEIDAKHKGKLRMYFAEPLV